MRNITIPTVCLAITLLTFGCSQPKGNFKLVLRRITITTEPEGADVVQLRPLGQKSLKLGTTPLNEITVSVIMNPKFKHMPFDETQEIMKHTGTVVVEIRKDGFQPYNGVLSTKAAETSVHNIILQPKK